MALPFQQEDVGEEEESSSPNMSETHILMTRAHAYDMVRLWKSEDNFVSAAGFEPILPGLCSKHLIGRIILQVQRVCV